LPSRLNIFPSFSVNDSNILIFPPAQGRDLLIFFTNFYSNDNDISETFFVLICQNRPETNCRVQFHYK
jgi:hypothetical protein